MLPCKNYRPLINSGVQVIRSIHCSSTNAYILMYPRGPEGVRKIPPSMQPDKKNLLLLLIFRLGLGSTTST